MIEDPFGPGWAQYNNEVRLPLWRSADVFQERILDMRRAAEELKKKLAIDQNGKVRKDSRYRPLLARDRANSPYVVKIVGLR